MNSVIELLATWARKEPELLLYGFLNRNGEIVDSYTYADFDRETDRLARVFIDELCLSPGEPIMLAFGPGLGLILAFIACAKVGALPIPMPLPSSMAPASLDRLLYVSTESGAKKILSDKRIPGIDLPQQQLFCGTESERLARSPIWAATIVLGIGEDEFLPRNDLLFLQYTSGSTRLPRGVMVSHQNVIANCCAVINQRHIGVSWLPHFHDFGLVGYLLFPLVHGGTAYHFSPSDFVRRPMSWLEAISRYRATITSAPNFAFDYCLREDRISDDALRKIDLSSLTLMMNGSERVRPETMCRFADRFSRTGLARAALVGSYGLAENTLGVSAGRAGHIVVDKQLIADRKVRISNNEFRARGTAIASCGRPLPGVVVELVSPETGLRVKEDQVGEVWLSGPSKCQGYWRNPVLTSEVFEARIAGDQGEERFLRTGDMGFFLGGELYICGRLKDLIIVRGVNLYPTDVEAVVEEVLQVAQGSVAAFGFGQTEDVDDGVVILIECRPDHCPDLASLYRKIWAGIKMPILAIAAVPKGSVVRTSSGKIARRECRKLWQNRSLTTLDMLALDETELTPGGLAAFIEMLLERSAGDASMTLADLDLDSFELVTLSLEIERFLTEVGRDIPVSEKMFDLDMLQTISLEVLNGWVTDVRSGATDIGSVMEYCAHAAKQRLDRDEEAMLVDAELPREVNAEAIAGRVPRPKDGGFLLTGASGFLGSFLLEALLRLTDRRIWVVARGSGVEEAQRHVRNALSRAGCMNDSDRRVEVLVGDLRRPRLGLTDTSWNALSYQASDIIHCGAEVDYVRRYDALREANVLSVKELLKLCSVGAEKTVHQISTTFIFGWSTERSAREDDYNSEMRGLDFGYSQSKWVAEQLLIRASAAGIDARIYRPAFITASRSGCASANDVFVRTLAYMIRHQVSVDIENQLSVVPVDICAQNIVALSLMPSCTAQTFHLTGKSYYTMRAACEAVENLYGYKFKYLDVTSFINHMKKFCKPDDPLYALQAFFRKNSIRLQAMRLKRYDNSNFRLAERESREIVEEPPLSEAMKWVIESLLQQNLIPRPPKF
jgi:thioester reductase-like protein